MVYTYLILLKGEALSIIHPWYSGVNADVLSGFIGNSDVPSEW
ncbi:hypothetical protein [Companilactobacillus insicii]|nr:hypothetical protein [Companilactobacillus insicii]